MLYVIHGDDTIKAHDFVMDKKHKAAGKEIREINGKHLDENALVQALESSSLFGGDVLVVIEHYLSTAKKREKKFAIILDRILTASESIDIILYEEKELDKSTIAKLGNNAIVSLFKTPAVLFQFLDGFVPGNTAPVLKLFSQTVSREPVEIVFSLLTRRVRNLIELKDGIMPLGVLPWQEARLTNQAQHFTMEQLITMHAALLNIDIAIKTGSTPFSLTQLLEQTIVSL